MTSFSTYAALLWSLENGPAVPCQEFATARGRRSLDTREVFSRALTRGRQLAELGLARGERVGIVVTEPEDFLPLVHGCLMYGFVAVPLYPPSPFGRLEAYRETLSRISTVANTQLLVVDDKLRTCLGAIGAKRLVELGELTSIVPRGAETNSSAGVLERPLVEAEDLALLQFTSGSTSVPRGVRITHAALMANVRAIMIDGLRATSADRGVSWLPLYHDMGLIGFGLAPLLTQTPVTFLATSRFVRSPSIWLQTLSDVRGTITFAPNFAYALVTKRQTPQGLDLSSVRMWGCGAEPVSERVLSAFERHFADAGVARGSVAPCYGLAEATLAVTFTPPGVPRTVARVETAKLYSESRIELVPDARDDDADQARVTTIVSSGQPLLGYEVRVLDERGHDVGEDHVGEIVVRGPSLGSGYEADATATAHTFGDDLRTGDRGFLRRGHLFVTGRIKDTLIANGRKYDPHVLEECAEQVSGVRRAAAVNVTTADGEALVVFVESSGEGGEQTVENVRARIAAHVGVAVTRVVCVAPGAIPRTTSGKLRRAAAKRLFEDG